MWEAKDMFDRRFEPILLESLGLQGLERLIFISVFLDMSKDEHSPDLSEESCATGFSIRLGVSFWLR